MRHFILARLIVCSILLTAAAHAQSVNPADLLKRLLDLPAPAPPGEKRTVAVKTTEREPSFFNKTRVPPDDAPLEDLVEYWERQSRDYRRLYYNAKPSEKTVARLLEFCEENPDRLTQFLNVFPTDPQVAETVKKIYDSLSGKAVDDYRLEQIRTWLVYHSSFFIEELVRKAEKVGEKDEYVTNQDDLLALSDVDWERAVPILEKLIASEKTQPVSAVLARWAYYSHALRTGDELDVSKYRRQLQDVVENRRASAGERDLALDALSTEAEWDGRDEWYLSLLGDETLYELKVNGSTNTGLTTMLLAAPPEKYVKAMASLVEHKNPTVRRAAIKNLMVHLSGGEPPVEAVRALLPWLANPNWAPEFPGGRTQLINAVGKLDLPETVPALINILMNEPAIRYAVAEVLVRYKDPRAVPALKTALAAENLIFRRHVLIRAIDAAGGFSDDEKMAALELFAEAVATPEARQKLNAELYREYDENRPNTVPVAVNLGGYLAGLTDPGDGLAARAVEREKKLRRTSPAVAASLFEIMQKWRGRVIYVERLRRIRAGEADLETILLTLGQRLEIRQKNESDIIAMRTAGGVGRGIAACLLDDGAEFEAVLRGTDTNALITMLGCGRLLRARFPVAEVGALLKNPNKTLALAAERYLEAEDSPEARTLVLAQHAGEAVLLGARDVFPADPKNYALTEPLRELLQSVSGRGYLNPNHPLLDKSEAALREEIKANPDLVAIFGILPNAAAGQQIIRLFKDKIVFTNYEDVARYRERVLTAKEYEDFYRLVMDEKIDTALPFFGYCDSCSPTEFVMFGKNGGRRVFFTDAWSERSPLKKLVARIVSFNEGELKLHYRLADSIKGLEVLLADDKFTARAVWKNGGDLRVLVEDKDKQAEIQKAMQAELEAENKQAEDESEYDGAFRREEQQKRLRAKEYEHFSWRSIENGRLGGIASQPLEAPYLYDETQLPKTEGIDQDPRAWKVRAGNYEIRVTDETADEPGLLKASRTQPQPQMMAKGSYDFPLTTGDGRWVIASKTKVWSEPRNVVRIDLRTGKEFPVNLPPADVFKPIAFIASQNKVLLYRARGSNDYEYRREANAEDEEETDLKPVVSTPKDDKNPSPETPEYYLLDPSTGATALVRGEFRPLEQADYRPLQAAAASPDEFWAALYDKKAKETAVGRYSTKTFTFQPIVKLPQIRLDSMNIWVDEKESKVYFVYEGHLLSAPLPK